MKIIIADTKQHQQLWQQFVDTHKQCSNYHRWGWKQVIQESFGWPTFYLMAVHADKARGILPLVWQRSWMFGNFLTSLPFVDSGGVVADGESTEKTLVQEAIELARRLGTNHLEFRHRRDHHLGLPAKTNKVTFLFAVKPDPEKIWQFLPTRVRTAIRKAEKSGLTAKFGALELLDEFYEVFAENMRDLGTPVYSKTFFHEIFRAFPGECFICIVRTSSTAVGASFLICYRDALETPWGSCLARAFSLKPNMFMYWKLLCFAAERGYRIFNFGRSSISSGPYRFKKQWGCQEIGLHWDYWLRNGTGLPELNPQNPRYRLAISLWQKLPVPLTKLIGPRIVRCLP